MCKEVLIISGSTRKNGNTELMANAFMQGALSSGHHVTMTPPSKFKDPILYGLRVLSKEWWLLHAEG